MLSPTVNFQVDTSQVVIEIIGVTLANYDRPSSDCRMLIGQLHNIALKLIVVVLQKEEVEEEHPCLLLKKG